MKSCKRLAYQFHQRKRSKFNWHQGISLGLSLCHSPGKAHSLFFSYIHNVRILFMHAWGYTAGRPLYGLAQHLLRPKEVPLGVLFFPHSAQNPLDNRRVNCARFAYSDSDEKIGSHLRHYLCAELPWRRNFVIVCIPYGKICLFL